MGEEASTSLLVVGGRNSLRSTLLIAAVTALLLPGFGVVILPAMFLGDKFQWGGVAWVVFWAMPAFIVRALQREHRLDGEHLVSTYRNRVVKRPLSEVVAVRAAPLLLPAARLRLGDASHVWAYGPTTESFISAVLQRAPFAENQLAKWEVAATATRRLVRLRGLWQRVVSEPNCRSTQPSR